MLKKLKCILFTLSLVCSLPTNGNDWLNLGLYFSSFEVDKDKRTCLDLTPERPFVLNKGFSMEFEIKLRREYHNFGYIFRIICNDTLNVDLLADITSNIANFSLVIKNRTVIQYKNSEIGNTIENTWIKALFVFDPATGNISLSLNGSKKEAYCSLTGLKRFHVCFGRNMHGVFSTTDIAPMLVKDIRFFDDKNKLIRHWELAKHSLDDVYDVCISDKATVKNPVWEIDRHVRWNMRQALHLTDKSHKMAFDRKEGHFYFVGDNYIHRYDINRDESAIIEVVGGVPFNIALANQIVYDTNRGVLLSYDFEGRQLAAFDFAARRWNNNDGSAKAPRYSHHGRLFIAEDSLLVTFGGYGYHRYNSLFYKCRIVDNIWEATDLSNYISPRYLGGMGRLEGSRDLLYFGGIGNESGLQVEFPLNYYDLYTINIDCIGVSKVWELPKPKEDFTNSNSLVIDKAAGDFYALAYPNKRYASVIKLHKYSLDKPEYSVLGDSIPYFFNDIESFCDLFQSADKSELYAITSHVGNEGADINIYSIAFPPLSKDEITQQPAASSNVYKFLLIVLPVGIAGIFLIYIRRKKPQTVIAISPDKPIDNNTEVPIVYDNILSEKTPSSISLLGNFQIVDSEGNDITKKFTPTITQLFLLPLISSINNGQGITSQEIKKILWYDKDNDNARNNMNVYISKLRAVLKSFVGVKFVSNNGYWTIQYEKKVFCDYERALILIKTLKAGEQFNKKLLAELVDIALRGALLPYSKDIGWLEQYQADYANSLIECLMRYSKYEKLKADFLLMLKLADVILLHDNIDEEAINIKCCALYQLGRKNQARQAFNKFTADYENLLATKHNLVFENMVKRDV